MEFQIKALLLSFIATVLVGFVIIPILRRFKVGQTEREDGPESHLVKQGTPTMGGIMLMFSIIALTICGYLAYINTEPNIAQSLVPISLVALGFGAVGFVDDFKKLILKDTTGLKPAYKMIGLLIVATFYVIYLISFKNIGTEIFIPIFKIYFHIPLFIYIPFTIFVLLAITNAVNLTDGVDGLATSVTTIIVTCLTAISIIYEVKEITIFGCIVCGTCVGFLLFNLNKAKIFMGDTGSLLLGGVIGGMAIYMKNPLIILLVAIIPICETLSVIFQVIYFKKTGKRLFKMAPLHHHFELSGWKENKVVIVFSGVTLIFCLLAMLTI